jgi:hypothetical protein
MKTFTLHTFALFFAELGFELRASCLLGRQLYHLSSSPALLLLFYQTKVKEKKSGFA